jgi:hypothetical protein
MVCLILTLDSISMDIIFGNQLSQILREGVEGNRYWVNFSNLIMNWKFFFEEIFRLLILELTMLFLLIRSYKSAKIYMKILLLMEDLQRQVLFFLGWSA